MGQHTPAEAFCALFADAAAVSGAAPELSGEDDPEWQDHHPNDKRNR